MPSFSTFKKAVSLVLTFCYICVSGMTYAQFELRSATIITQTDTLLGKIKFYDWDITPMSIDFVNASGPDQTFPAHQIRQLVIFPGIVYSGHQVNYTVYKSEESSISAALVGHPTTDYLLLELLLESEAVKLYRLFDSNKNVRFFLEKEAIMYPLDNIETIVKAENKASAYENSLFRTTLKQVLSECPTLNTDAISYTEKDIVNVLKEYHSYCRINSRIYKEQTDIGKIQVSLGAIWGVFPFPKDININPVRYEQASEIGLSVRLLLPRRFSNYFILAELAKVTIPNSNPSDPATNLALYGGRYFGKRDVKGLWYTGVSVATGPLDTGVGLSYKKIISASASLPVLALLFTGFSQFVPPAINFRLHLPLTK